MLDATTISLIGLVVTVGGFYVGRMSVSKKDGEKDGVVLTEIGYIKSGIDDIKQWQRDEERQRIDMQERLVILETKVTDIMAHCCDERKENV